MSKATKFPKVEYNGLRRHVYELIKDVIIKGGLKPNERIVESKIANEFSVSRGPVREAIRDLAKEGVVTHVPRKGTFVTVCSIRDIEEIYSLRAVLEGLAIRRALKYLTKKEIKKLEKLKDEIVTAAKSKNIIEMVKKDIKFHKIICYSSKHSRLIKFWSDMDYQIRMFLVATDVVFHNPKEVAERHNKILDAIKEKNPDKAEKCIKNHIVQVGEEIVDIFRKKEKGNEGIFSLRRK